MKKTIITLLLSFIFVSLIPLNGNFDVVAESHYSFGCNASEFEVSYINDDGSFTKISCHSNLSEAKNVMKTNEDYVVRQGNSYSDTKIVAMNSGLVYTYPVRANTSTMAIYQNPDTTSSSLYKQTYVSRYYEMNYVKTHSCNSDGRGYVRVVLNGFEGFADLEYCDLVPFKYIEKNIPIYLGGYKGGTNSYNSQSPYLVRLEQNYYMIEDSGNYTDLVFYYHMGYNTNGNKCLTYADSVDNAQNYLDAGMQKGVKYYSSDGINFYSDKYLTNKVATVYNYYQFLSLRTKTNVTADQINSFISSRSGSVLNGKGQAFINAQNKYGCNALIVFAMACLESAYGTSGYATKRNNLFGWNAYDDSPDDASYFSSVDNCVNEQMGRNLCWFMDYTNYRYFGTCVGNKGAGINVHYASDPYWGSQIAAIAYSIDKAANNKNGNLSDYNTYTIAFVKDNYNDVLYSSNISWDPSFYNASTGSGLIYSPSGSYYYTGRYGSHYQKDLTIAIIGDENGRYKFNTANPLIDGVMYVDAPTCEYSWSKSVAYVDKANVVVLNNKQSQTETDNKKESTYEPLISIRSLELTSDSLIINGLGAIQGMDFDDLSKLKHQIIFYDLNDTSKYYVFDAETIDSNGYTQNDGWNYKYTGYNLAISLPNENLPAGSYYAKLKITNGEKVVEKSLYSSEIEYRLLSSNNSSNTYRIRMNDYVDYRFEIDVLSIPDVIDFSSVNKPSGRPSLVSLDSIELSAEGNLDVKAHAYMYYLNYSDTNNIKYELYLVNSSENYIKLDGTLYDSGIDYKSILNSKYDINNICFDAAGDISSLEEGEYIVYLVMSNTVDGTTYKDICEFINYGFDLPSVTIGDKTYEFYTSNIRDRIMLNVQKDS